MSATMVFGALLAFAPSLILYLSIKLYLMYFYEVRPASSRVEIRTSSIAHLGIATILTYWLCPVFMYTPLLICAYVFLSLAELLTESIFCFSVVALASIVTFVQYWDFLGVNIMATLEHTLSFFLIQYRWKRFIIVTVGDGRYSIMSKMIIYLCDWVHYRVVGDWKVVALYEFQLQHLPGQQPANFAQLQERFVRELQGLMEQPNNQDANTKSEPIGDDEINYHDH